MNGVPSMPKATPAVATGHRAAAQEPPRVTAALTQLHTAHPPSEKLASLRARTRSTNAKTAAKATRRTPTVNQKTFVPYPNHSSHIRLKCPRSTSTTYRSAASAGSASGSGSSHRR